MLSGECDEAMSSSCLRSNSASAALLRPSVTWSKSFSVSSSKDFSKKFSWRLDRSSACIAKTSLVLQFYISR